MAIPSVMSDLSTTANSNSPSGSENPGQGDDFLRAIQAILRATNAKGADIASSTTTDIGAATGEFVDVTGTTTITGLGTIAAGIRRTVRFTGILILTHNGTSLILPSSANITTQAGDIAQFRSLGSGNWVCTDYLRKDGTALVLTVADASITQPKLDTALRKQFNTIQDFRLTLTTALPVTTSDVTGATTIYCTPYKGNTIALYDGTNWNLRTSAEFSLALGTLSSGKPYDVFCYDSAGVPTLEFLVWTNDTTRATALVYQDGILVKSGATTRRYMGTFYTTSTTTTEDSIGNRYLWNYYHRAKRWMRRIETAATWNYTVATHRQANANTANQLNFVVGVSEDAVNAVVSAGASNTVGASVICSVGLDNTTTPSTPYSPGSAFTVIGAAGNQFDQVVTAGRHFLAWLEWSTNTGVTTWQGSNFGCGISGHVWA